MAPLFFNVYSSRSFEPDKTSLVRTLALVMVAAWLVIRAERLRLNGRSSGSTGATSTPPQTVWMRLRRLIDAWSRENPLILPTLALVAVYIISTIASVSPTLSLFGSYTRLQGTYSTFSYIVIFLLTASTMRDKSQLNRAINVALMTSFPIAFYGLIQHYFLDPLPWAGDVNTRVASNMGNSIFVGAFLIMVIPLALGRLIQQSGQAAAQFTGQRARLSLYALVVLSVGILVAAWGLVFEFGAKKLIEGQLQDRLTSAQLAAALGNFNTALLITVALILAWWVAAFLLKKRAGIFLLIGIYAFLLTVQALTLFFTQSRGPLLGFIAGMFAFVLLYALARGFHRLALGGMGAAAIGALLLIVINVSTATPLEGLRNLPYVGRLGQILETEGGTGLVRVLIWQGALPLVLPHAPLWSPTSGDDVLNPVRPLIGYGPETLFVSYSRFYPPELAHLEARNATPDRSHNETYDALTSTGLLGFIAENTLFLCIFYFGLKWLGLINTARERNIFIALWYVGGIVATIILGVTMGWYFLGVALPAGMLAGLFIYLAGFALLRSHEVKPASDPTRALFIVMFLAAIIAHFVEIHFGIAIVSTRTYFWFLAGLLVFVGVRYTRQAAAESETAPLQAAEAMDGTGARARRRKARRPIREPQAAERRPRPQAGGRVISTTPLLAQAFIAGLILSTMAFAYITNTNVHVAAGQNATGLDFISSALTVKATVDGLQPSFAMAWLFVGTFLLMLVIAVTEWAGDIMLPLGEWALAVGLYAVLAIAILASFLLYHTLLISSGTPDALFATVTLFVVFMLVMVVVIAITLLMDDQPGPLWVARPTNWIVAPILAVVAVILIFSSNVSTVQADMIYKQAVNLSGGDTLPESIDLYKRALQLEPSQDYYWLFLGRAYLQLAQTGDDKTRQQALDGAEKALQSALSFNPLNTDHSANLARLHQAWANFSTDPTAKQAEYQKAFQYYQNSLKLSPNTAHLYDQYAQALLEYVNVQQQQKNTEGAAQTRQKVSDLLSQSAKLDPTFCLTNAVQSEADQDWQTSVQDALTTFQNFSNCAPFTDEARGTASLSLASAMDKAIVAKQGEQYSAQLEQVAAKQPAVEIYTALVNYYSKSGQIDKSIRSLDAALELIPESDTTTRKQYTDFRASLATVQQGISQTLASPNDAEAHRKLADMWLLRSQYDLALPEYQKVAALLPNDYEAHRRVTLLLLQQNQLSDASQSLATTLDLAPADAKPLWEQLRTILDAAQGGKKDAALSSLQALLKTDQAKDQLVQTALNALSDNLQSK